MLKKGMAIIIKYIAQCLSMISMNTLEEMMNSQNNAVMVIKSKK